MVLDCKTDYMIVLIATTSSWFFPLTHTNIPLFISGLPTHCPHSLREGRDAKILPISDHEASALHISNTESLDGLAYFPICSWPGDIRHLFHKSKIGDIDTFKFVLFALGNKISPHLLLNFLFIKYRKNTGKIPKHVLQI